MRKRWHWTVGSLFGIVGGLLAGCSADPAASLHPVQPERPLRSTTEFSVVSYNIQARPVLDRCEWKSLRIGERIQGDELVGFQESFAAHGALKKKNALHGEVYFGKRRHALKLVNSGLAVFTRFPIETADAEYFQEEGSLENRLGSKGVLMVRLQLNGAPLDFYTTHLAAGSPGVSGEARIAQLGQIAAFIRRTSPPENAVILCGDFNLTLHAKQKELLNFLNETGLRNPAAELKCEKKSFIDHVFYRPSSSLPLKPLSWAVLKQEFPVSGPDALSDHAPLRVRFSAAGP